MSSFALPVRIVEGNAGGGLNVLNINIDFAEPTDGNWELTVHDANKILDALDDVMAHPEHMFEYKILLNQHIAFTMEGQAISFDTFATYDVMCSTAFNGSPSDIAVEVYMNKIEALFDIAPFRAATYIEGYEVDIQVPSTGGYDTITIDRSMLDDDGVLHYSHTSA